MMAPSFPLDPAAFVLALRTGHGRALQHVQSHGAHGLERLIIDACLECQSYDPQCEADKAPWLRSIVACAHLEAEVIGAIGAWVDRPPEENHRDLDHRSAMLRELAAAGSSDARQLLYLSLVRLQGTTADVIADHDIVELDGLDGLVHVARQLGHWLQGDPDFWVSDVHIVQCDSVLGVGQGRAALEHEAASDPAIACYLASVDEFCLISSEGARRSPAMVFTGAQIVAHALATQNDTCHWFSRWSMQAAPSELATVFRALLDCEKPVHAQRLLRCFVRKDIPAYDRRLLRWTDRSEPRLRSVAIQALASVRHPDLRDLALQWMASGDLVDGVQLLVANFEPGDLSQCARHLERVHDVDEVHQLGSVILELCQAHLDADVQDCLLEIYELSPCATCRSRAAKVLVETGVAPTWLQEECALDADPDTRALASL
jgi:hypothetical protein